MPSHACEFRRSNSSQRDLPTGARPRQLAAAAATVAGATAGAAVVIEVLTLRPIGPEIGIPPPSPVEARPPEPPDAEYRTDDQERDFDHGHHVETPSPETQTHHTRNSSPRRAKRRLTDPTRNALSCRCVTRQDR